MAVPYHLPSRLCKCFNSFLFEAWEMNDAASKVAHDNLHGRRHFDQRERAVIGRNQSCDRKPNNTCLLVGPNVRRSSAIKSHLFVKKTAGNYVENFLYVMC